MATESKISVSVIDETIGLGANPGDSGIGIFCPVVSPTGPTKLTKVSGPSQLRRLFNANLPITSSSNKTLRYARALANHAPLYIKRAARSSIRAGKSSGLKTTVYVDENDNVLDTSLLTLTANYTVTNYAAAVMSYVGSDSFVKLGTNTYCIASSTVSTSDDIISKVDKYTPVASNAIVISRSGSTAQCIVRVGSESYTFTGTDNLYYIVTRLFSGKSKPVYMSITTNESSVSSTEHRQFCYDYSTSSFKTPSDTLAPSSWNTVSLSSEHISNNDIITLVFSTSVDIDYGNSSALETYIYTPTTVADLSNIKVVTMSSYSDYANSFRPIAKFNIKNSDNDTILNFSYEGDTTIGGIVNDVIEQLNAAGYPATTISKDCIVVGGAGLTIADFDAGTEGDLTFSNANGDAIPVQDRFAVISKFPNSSDLMQVTVTTSSTDVYTVIVKYQSDESEEWKVSFTEGATDAYGNDIYYTVVNQNSDYIDIIELDGSVVLDGTFAIGSQVTNDLIDIDDETSSSAIVAAIEEMIETEESPVRFDYVTDGGLVNTSLSAALMNLADEYYSFYPASCAVDEWGITSLINRRNVLESANGRGNFIAAAQKTSALDSGITTLPASYWYLARRIALYGTVQEYVALFGKNYGVIGITQPVHTFSKSTRETLLGEQIVTLTHSLADDTWCLNDNLTTLSTDSFLQEDGISLMCNRIAKIAYDYSESLIGSYNTSELRSRVEAQLSLSITNALRVGTQYGPDSITVVCNDTNNPVSLRNQRKLRIDVYGRFNRSIKDVLIYTHVQSLES